MNSANAWFLEKRGPTDWHYYGIKKILHEEKTEYQLIQVFDTFDYGICLALDGKARVFTVDEFIFHESMIHPIMSCHPNPKHIFLAGDGDGGSVREISRYSFDKLTWVELDKRVIDVSEEFLGLIKKEKLSQSSIDLVTQNARSFLESTDNKYDIMFISATEPIKDNPSQVLYTEEFLELSKSKLKHGGFIVQSVGCTSFGYLQQYCQMVNTYKKVFSHVSPFQVGLPSFGVSWGFIVASENPDIPNLTSYRRPDSQNELRFYDENTHLSLFALPQYLRDGIDKFKIISTDKNPIWVY